MRRTVLIGAVVLGVGVAVVGAGTAIGAVPAFSVGEDERDGADTPLTGSDRDRAVAAALAHTGGGTVTETEVGDDGAAYGVEVRLPDGRQVEVELDTAFAVVGEESDDD